jgi:hypothetical protein
MPKQIGAGSRFWSGIEEDGVKTRGRGSRELGRIATCRGYDVAYAASPSDSLCETKRTPYGLIRLSDCLTELLCSR